MEQKEIAAVTESPSFSQRPDNFWRYPQGFQYPSKGFGSSVRIQGKRCSSSAQNQFPESAQCIHREMSKQVSKSERTSTVKGILPNTRMIVPWHADAQSNKKPMIKKNDESDWPIARIELPRVQLGHLFLNAEFYRLTASSLAVLVRLQGGKTRNPEMHGGRRYKGF